MTDSPFRTIHLKPRRIEEHVNTAQQLAQEFANDFQDVKHLLAFATLRKNLRSIGVLRILLEPDAERPGTAVLTWASHVGPEPDTATKMVEHAGIPMSFYKVMEDSSLAIDDDKAVIDIDQDENYYEEVIAEIYDIMIDHLNDFHSATSVLERDTAFLT